ncbi:MAG: membrane dipeptidase [Bacteroidota bacterium]
MENCIDGNVRLVVISLYPIERQYVNRKSGGLILLEVFILFPSKFNPLKFWQKRKIIFRSLIKIFLGISTDKIDSLWFEQSGNRKRNVDYFKDYHKELEYFTNSEFSQPHNPKYSDKKFRLVRNYREYIEIKDNPKIIAGILSVEGIHSFGKYRAKDLFSKKNIDRIPKRESDKLKDSFAINIKKIKESINTPFFVSMSHHYNNLVSGHCQSFEPPMTAFFRQKGGMNAPLTEFGIKIIKDYLLDKNYYGKRILIDIKHFSIKSRIQFYKIIDEYRVRGDNIPIISSHSAVSGFKTLEESRRRKDSRKLNKRSYVSRWDINLTDEDIITIYKTDGLIGILMHAGRMPGKVIKDRLKRAKNEDETQIFLAQLFLINVYHIVHVIRKTLNEDGWKCVCLGTDNDGIVSPFEGFEETRRLPKFRKVLIEYLDNYDNLDKDEYKIPVLSEKGKFFTSIELRELNNGRTNTEVIYSVFYTNLDSFLSKYFTEEYLHK